MKRTFLYTGRFRLGGSGPRAAMSDGERPKCFLISSLVAGLLGVCSHMAMRGSLIPVGLARLRFPLAHIRLLRKLTGCRA